MGLLATSIFATAIARNREISLGVSSCVVVNLLYLMDFNGYWAETAKRSDTVMTYRKKSLARLKLERAIMEINLEKQIGISALDSLILGLGKGASGNVATEDVVYMLNGLRVKTNVDLDKFLSAGKYVNEYLGRSYFFGIKDHHCIEPRASEIRDAYGTCRLIV